MNVDYEGKHFFLPLVIVDINQNTPLLGRNWLTSMPLNWSVFHRQSPSINFININDYSDLFDGCYTGDPIKLDVDEDPKFHCARKVPYAIQSKVELALNDLEASGILRKIKTANVLHRLCQLLRSLVTFVFAETSVVHIISVPVLQSTQFLELTTYMLHFMRILCFLPRYEPSLPPTTYPS